MIYLITCSKCGRKTETKKIPFTLICQCGAQLYWQEEQRQATTIKEVI